MTALEARTQSVNSWNSVWDRLYQVNVQDLIKTAINNGQFSCTVPYLSPLDISKLKDSGFTIRNVAYCLFEVSW